MENWSQYLTDIVSICRCFHSKACFGSHDQQCRLYRDLERNKKVWSNGDRGSGNSHEHIVKIGHLALIKWLHRPRRPSTCSSRSLAVLDSIWAVAVCLPAVCLYWRGGWSLLDFYILSDHVPNKYWLMVALGNLMLVTFWLLEPIDAHLRDASRVKYVIVTRVLFESSRTCGLLYGKYIIADIIGLPA